MPSPKISKLYITFPFLFFFIAVSFSQITIKPLPNWVEDLDYERTPDISEDDISYGLLTLLSDSQTHVPKQQSYNRIVQKITDNVGIQDASLISINFDPTYQSLQLHKIEVIRDNRILNKLNLNDFQSIRKESNSESYIYDGSINATANLSDIRTGDILDVSYSIIGFNPLHKKFSSATVLNDYVPLGRVHVKYLSRSKLYYKLLNSDLKPIVKNQGGLQSYTWIASNTKSAELEDGTPQWYMQFQNLFVTEYENWGQVVEWALPIYQKDKSLSAGLKKKINEILESSELESERITAALRFVQNEIRYLGLESGIGAYKPFKPNKVFNQRFGDCKDKSWLLVNMLRALQVEAHPVLVNSTYGNALPDLLPTPNVFDHVIVKVIDSTENAYFYDPTNSNQGGKHGTITMPNFGYGLVLKKTNDKLEPIEIKHEDLVEVFDTFTVTGVNKEMTLNVTSVYRESEADIMRDVLKSNSLTSLNKDYRNYYKSYYEDAEILEPMVFEDDTIANKITIEESYRFNNVWEPMIGDEDKIAINFMPYSLYNVLPFPEEKERDTPYSLYYPIRKKHNITVKLPMAWGITNSNTNVDSKHFKFSLDIKTNRPKDILYLNYDYTNKSSFIPSKDYEEFYADYKKIENSMSYYVYIPKSAAGISSFLSSNDNKASSNNEDTFRNIGEKVGEILLYVFGVVGLIALALVVYVIKGNKNRPD